MMIEIQDLEGVRKDVLLRRTNIKKNSWKYFGCVSRAATNPAGSSETATADSDSLLSAVPLSAVSPIKPGSPGTNKLRPRPGQQTAIVCRRLSAVKLSISMWSWCHTNVTSCITISWGCSRGCLKGWLVFLWAWFCSPLNLTSSSSFVVLQVSL